MFVTAKMIQLVGSALLEDMDKITRVFLKNGNFEPLMIEALEGTQASGLSYMGNASMHDRILELQQRVEALLRGAKIAIPLVDVNMVDKMEPVRLDLCQKLLTQIDNSVRELREKQKKYEDDLRHKSELLQSMKADAQLLEFGSAIDDLQKNSHTNDVLRVRAGKINHSFFANFLDKLSRQTHAWLEHTTREQQTLIRLVYFKEEEALVSAILDQAQWTEIPIEDVLISSEETSINQLVRQIEKIEAAQAAVQQAVVQKISSYRQELLDNWVSLHMNERYAQLQKNFSQTTYSCFFAGWVPSRNLEKLKKALIATTNGRIQLEVVEAANVRDQDGKRVPPPTAMKNPPLVKPFEALVKIYGVPAYNTIDCSALVGLLFVLMFGFMFADVGHGAVIFLAGIATLLFAKNKPKDLAVLILYCGLASMVCGAIFGSYFGFQLTKPLWFDYESIAQNHASKYILKTSIISINDVFKVSIIFGVVVIYLSYLLNWVNRMRRREWIELFLERNGILGGWMYAVGIGLVWNYVASNYNNFGDTTGLWLTLGIPISCLFFAEPAKYFLQKKYAAGENFAISKIGQWLGHWLIEVFEFIVNSLSNTISFIRVAGLGLAHIVLMSTFYDIAKDFGPISSTLIVILANIIVIALEGLSAAINSVRLNYYEFFSRFFIGNGRLYEPIRLNKN
ncbi:MAG: V-type ATP synthase subunit I [Spirochaetia bacterium]